MMSEKKVDDGNQVYIIGLPTIRKLFEGKSVRVGNAWFLPDDYIMNSYKQERSIHESEPTP